MFSLKDLDEAETGLWWLMKAGGDNIDAQTFETEVDAVLAALSMELTDEEGGYSSVTVFLFDESRNPDDPAFFRATPERLKEIRESFPDPLEFDRMYEEGWKLARKALAAELTKMGQEVGA